MAEHTEPPIHPPTRAATDEVTSHHGPDHGISFNFPEDGSPHKPRPVPKKQMSAPAYQSPMRHHQRVASRTKAVKETLDARSHYASGDDEGAAVHRINQYIVKQEIGRGSFGAVHQAVDQFDNEYAVKEFSKSRLRKRAQSNLLRNPNRSRRPGHLSAGLGFNSPLHRQSSSDKLNRTDTHDSLELIKEEIAIMKKLNHHNLVSLIEVLDDPQEDSLYMVMEMCKKGVVMKVGLGERAEPYSEDICRCWFRDMILGVEYLHAQGVVHRDIKPDNCLITDDDVLKIVDFGVSEMFEKESDMATAKSAGSPAFMPPELCIVKHGHVSGRAADVWSMGVTLYCLRYGHIPFEKTGIFELYESIREDKLSVDDEKDANFEDLIRRILEKDPDKRITIEEMRVHPWVTQNGTDPLLSAVENCADLIEPPTESEMNHAITGSVGHLMVVMKAVNRFKKLIYDKSPNLREGIFGRNTNFFAPPSSIETGESSSKAAAGSKLDTNEVPELRRSFDDMIVESPEKSEDEGEGIPISGRGTDSSSRMRSFDIDDHAKGHAHDPLMDSLFLDIGADPDAPHQGTDSPHPIVSESPPGVEIDIYEKAYQEEMNRIMERRGRDPSMYLNRRIDHLDVIKSQAFILDSGKNALQGAATKLGGLAASGGGRGVSGLASLVKQAQNQSGESSGSRSETEAEKAEPKEESAGDNDSQGQTT